MTFPSTLNDSPVEVSVDFYEFQSDEGRPGQRVENLVAKDSEGNIYSWRQGLNDNEYEDFVTEALDILDGGKEDG